MSQNTALTMIPRLSEKAYGLSRQRNTYVFDVPATVNKLVVAAAVAAQYEVAVETVNIVNRKGKVKQTVRKKSRAISGRQANTRIAYVRLVAGHSLPFFDADQAAAAEPAPAHDCQSAKSQPVADTKNDVAPRKRSVRSVLERRKPAIKRKGVS